MILIVTEEEDIITFKVCDWLRYLNKPFLILNENTSLFVENIELSNSGIDFNLLIDNISINFKEISSVWFWRGGFQLYYNKIADSIAKELQIGLERFIIDELNCVRRFIISELKGKTNYGNMGNANKLEMLSKARKVGLNVPPTLITTKRDDILKFLKKHNQIISKAISENVHFKTSREQYFYPNSLLTQKQILKLPNKFQVTLFQKYITKNIEVRIFIFGKHLFPMAIFSQSNKKTLIDYRNYDKERPNRNVRINLPKEIENKIRQFMTENKMNSGSIDMIYTPDQKFYFLEINPVGQFGNVSYECNYNIEKLIATTL